MTLRVPVGVDDFRMLRQAGAEYVDKSDLIRLLIERVGVQVVLLPRPRRFGKTLNLSMLRYWFEKREEDLSPLFHDLAIWKAGEEYRRHFRRYPVIHFNFKGTKSESFDETWSAIRRNIQVLFDEHAYLLQGGRLTERQGADYRAVLDGTAEDTLYKRALLDLSAYLHTHHGEQVVILLDEYDEPIHAGHVNGYASRILDFMRGFLGAGLKSNTHLYKAVVTGILRVAKESLFSGLNNLDVYSLLAVPFNTCFGFTEAEVAALLERSGQSDKLADVRAYYNGYLFGGEAVYNPWSVCCFLQHEDVTPKPYWIGTSSNDLVHELLTRHALSLEPLFETLLAGGSIERPLEENVALAELHESEDALWSLLVFAGYLKPEAAGDDAVGRPLYRLSIPNTEVRLVYATTFQRWMRARLAAEGGSVEDLSAALLGGDAEALEEQLQAFTTNLLSYHDVRLRPEQVYQAFVIGLLATLEPEYLVRSNRESGTGRPDVAIRPRHPGKPGVILELKVARPGKKTPKKALAEGLAQIRDHDYGAELRAAGATPIHAFAIAFDGKRVSVRASAVTSPPRRARRARASPPRR